MALLIGLFLMLMPQQKEKPVPQTESLQQQENLQTELESILSHLEGAGKVKVLLTQAAGERAIFQTDEISETSESGNSVHRNTVLITDSNREASALLQQTMAPVYLGAVVLCQGADRATVRLAIVEAVSRATGLASSNISVLKMK
jgi:stage III sporulation protein AG